MTGTEGQSSGRLTREQKVGFALLFVFALLTLGLGGLQLRNTIYGPFVIRLDQRDAASAVADDATRLRQADTDHDGLPDYDELNTYGTSPYLPDTDSDGVSDRQEVAAGADPNCPQGRSCTGEDILVGSSTPALVSPLLREGTDPARLLNLPGSNGQRPAGSPEAVLPFFQELLNNPVRLRAQLIATGRISKEALDKIDDQTLLQLVRGSLAEQGGLAALASTTPDTPYVEPQR